jgi:translocator protein
MGKVIKFVISLALPLGLGTIAGLFTAREIPHWYATLNRPSFAPPDWLFGPVWTALYILLGISFFLIWNLESGKQRNLAMAVFLLQLLLNFAWTFLFFYFKLIGVALVEIVALWLCIMMMIILFYKIKPIAAFINIPYLLWVTFATLLNAAFFYLNKS